MWFRNASLNTQEILDRHLPLNNSGQQTGLPHFEDFPVPFSISHSPSYILTFHYPITERIPISGIITDKSKAPTRMDKIITIVGSITETKFWISAVTSSSTCTAILESAWSVSQFFLQSWSSLHGGANISVFLLLLLKRFSFKHLLFAV